MANLFGDTYGFIHLIASVLALITGFMVLVMKKGTKRHVNVGYIYVLSMALLIATSFMIYRLFNGWGIFHYTSIISLITIALGMIPIWTKKPLNKWKYLHFSFMYWSVVGLYAAFAAEILTRIPETPFFGMVGIATGVIMLIGGIYFGMNKTKWMIIFGIGKK